MKDEIRKIAGQVIRDKAEVIIIFKVDGKYYPANDVNSELMDAYIHTGDESHLAQLENEVPF